MAGIFKTNDMKLEIGTEVTERYGTEVTERYGGKIRSIKKITRVTATRAFIKVTDTHETALKIESTSDGYVYKVAQEKWSQTSYNITTDKDRAEFKHALAVQKLKNTEWGKLPEETVFKILELLKPL